MKANEIIFIKGLFQTAPIAKGQHVATISEGDKDDDTPVVIPPKTID